MKKLISLLLSLVMVFSLAMPVMAAEDDTATVYFQNNWMWTDVRAYIHYTDDTENAAYPGTAMTSYENDGNYDIYSVTFPVSNIDYIIFSGIKDDGSGARDYSPQIPASDLYRNATYYMLWNDGNAIGKVGGEGESLDSAAAPSGPSITGGTGKDVTASYTPTYTITIDADIENGTVVADPTTAKAGDTVTLTVTPNDGYVLDTLTASYVDADGQTVELDVTNNTFEMPAADVTVTATFVEQTAPTYNVTIDADIENGTVVANKQTAEQGEEVVLTITPDEGYELETLTVGGDDVTASVQEGKYTFTMGEAAVDVTATFKAITYAVNIDTNVATGTVTVDKSTAAKGETVTVSVEAVAGYAYVVGSLTVTNDTTDEEVEVDEAAKTFVMPAADVTVYAEFEKLSVTSANIVWGSMAFTYSDEQVEQADGSTADKGWSNDGSEGAGTVTVTNTGNTTFIASASYVPAGEFGITGSLDEAKTLAAAESGTFTLTLSGKPNKALSGEKIGTVTVKIEEYDPVYLNISFGLTVTESNRQIGHSMHTVRFYDANGSLLSETAESTSATETVAVPSGAVTFALYYKPYDHPAGQLPIDRDWQTTAKTAVPTVDSNVSITFTNYYTTTVTVTAAQ